MRMSDWSSDVCSSDLAAGAVVHASGSGANFSALHRPASVLVDRQGEDARVVVKGVLHAVAVVGVDVEVEDVPKAAIEEGENGEHRVVEIAETARAVGAAVMGAAGRAVDRPLPRRQQRSEAHTSELQSLMRNSYAGSCLTKTPH